MMPSALALGDGGEFRAPMAISVIGGLLVSTLLSLVFVPSFFTVMDDLGWLTWRLVRGFIGPADEPETEVAGARVPAPSVAPTAPPSAVRPLAAE